MPQRNVINARVRGRAVFYSTSLVIPCACVWMYLYTFMLLSSTELMTTMKAMPNTNHNAALTYEDWPESSFEALRKDPSQRASIPTGNRTTAEIDCPQCLSYLLGSVLGKKILLLNHDINLAGGELLLLHVAELLEQSGASVRYLLLSETGPKTGPICSLIEEKGMSYLFWKSSSTSPQPIDFTGFDAVLVNTAAIESQHHFFEQTKAFLSPQALASLLKKTIVWIHEYDAEFYTNDEFTSVLAKSHRVLFDSTAGKEEWLKLHPAIADKTDVVWPSVRKEMMLELGGFGQTRKRGPAEKAAYRSKLKIKANAFSNDVVILQAATIESRKGSIELVQAFGVFLTEIPPDVLQKRAWFLVLVGNLALVLKDHTKFHQEVDKINQELRKKGARSRVIVRGATANVSDYYAASDIFVLNSPCENFGMVQVEAMFSHLPTIARDCGGSSEITKHGETGLLLPADADILPALAGAFAELTMKKTWQARLEKMGDAGFERARSLFSYARMARELSNVFSRLFFFSNADSSGSSWACSTSKLRPKPRNPREQELVHEQSETNSKLAPPPFPELPTLSAIIDSGCASFGSQLYVIGGYRDLDHVSKEVQYYDLDKNVWNLAPSLPERAAESHTAITSDDRYIFVLSGQLGAQCSRPVKSAHAYDTKKQIWSALPDLPVARYSGCAAIMNGKLHFVGGNDIDRRTPRRDHFSMSMDHLHAFLEDGTNVAPVWQREPDIPYGSGHVTCRVLSTSSDETKLFYFGGEAEDYYAKAPDRNDFTCVPGKEFHNPFVFLFDGIQWERGPDMPYHLSHVEGSNLVAPDTAHGPQSHAIFFGGSGRHEEEIMPDTPVLSDGMLLFSAESLRFERIGSLWPIGVARKAMCGIARLTPGRGDSMHADVFVYGGQASQSPSVPWPGPLENFALRCTNDHATLPDLG